MTDRHLGLRREKPHPTYPTRPSSSQQSKPEEDVALMGFPVSFAKKRWIVLVIGETDSGKTLFIRAMVYANRNVFDQIIVFSETAQYESPLRFTDSIVKTYKPELIDKIITIQEERLKAVAGDKPVDKMEGNPVPHILLVFDDLDIDYSQDPTINLLVTRSRHLYISIIFSVQYYTMVSRRMRYLAGFLCLRTIRGKGNMEELYDFLSHFFMDFKQFRYWSITALRDYATIVFKMRGDGIWEEDVREVKHDPKSIPKFTVGKQTKRRLGFQNKSKDMLSSVQWGL